MSTRRSTRRSARNPRQQGKYFRYIESLEQRTLFSFTIAVIPDTQHMVWVRGGDAAKETAWVQSQKTAQNIQFAIGLGDIVNDGASDNNEWLDAQTAWNNIAAMNIPFGTAQGNHDHDNWAGHPFPQTGWNSFNTYFGPTSSFYNGKSWYGTMPSTSPYYNSGGTNSYQKFTADGVTFLNICLEDEPSDLALQWADSVMAANPNMPTIITTHEFIDQNGGWVAVQYHNTTAPGAPDTPSGANSGSETWNWAKTHDNQIFMILCGHASGGVVNGWANGNHHATWTGNSGKPILVQMTDYQENTAGPNGTTLNGGAQWVRMMNFDLTAHTIRERTYSPAWGNYSDSIGVAQPFGEPISESDFTVDISGFTQIPGTTLPVINIAASGTPSEVGPTAGTYTLTRTGSTTNALTVNVAMSGTATNGTDYNPIASTVTFNAGQSSTTVTLTPINDGVAESAETAIMTVLAGSGYSVGSPTSQTFSIADSGASGAPAAPSNAAAAPSGSSLNVTWTDNSNNEQYFHVWRSTDNVSFSIVKNTGSNVTSYLDTAVTPGTVYYYKVTAENASGVSAYSNTASATAPGSVPAAPSGAAVAPSGNSLNLTWVDNSTNETGMRVWRSTDNVNFSIVQNLAANATVWLDNTVTAGTLYYYKVTATNASGDSPFSNTVSATAPGAIPAAPSNTAATPSGTSLNVTWSDNSNNEQYFHVWRSTDNVSFGIVKNTGSNVTSYLDTAVTPGTVYYYKVTAENASGTSAFSNTASATAPGSLPAAPTNLVAGVPGTTSLSMTWTDNATNETGFKVYRSTDNATWGSPIATIATPNTTSYTDTTPAAGVGYFYKVVAYNGAGDSSTAAGMTCEVATVQAHDRFNYTVGDGSAIAGQNNGVGLGANWTVSNNTLVSIVPGSLNYSLNGHALTTSGNSIKVTNFGSATGTLASPIGTLGTTTWIGFEIKSDRLSGSSTLNGEVRINGSTLRLGSPLSGNLSAIATGNLYLPSTIPANTGVTNFVVYRIQYLSTGSIIDMFANPTPGVVPNTPTNTLTLPSTTVLTVSSSIVVKSNNDATATNTIDEIRVGNSYLAVAPDPLVPITQPSIAISRTPDSTPILPSARELPLTRTPAFVPASIKQGGIEEHPATSNDRNVVTAHLSTPATVSVGQSVFEEHSEIQLPLAAARRPDASTNPSPDDQQPQDDELSFWME